MTENSTDTEGAASILLSEDDLEDVRGGIAALVWSATSTPPEAGHRQTIMMAKHDAAKNALNN